MTEVTVRGGLTAASLIALPKPDPSWEPVLVATLKAYADRMAAFLAA